MPDIREVRLLTEVLQREKLDSIVSYLNVVAAKEKFTKQDFTYYDNGLPHKMTNYYWSFAEEKWDDPAESTEFIVDDDGYVTSLIQMSGDNGARTDYVYDDKKLGIQQTVSGYSPTTDEWIPIQRGDYEYDDAGNMISEKISAWDTAAKTWMPVIKNFATWDEFGRQTGFEPYYFLSNGELEGNGEKQTYTYDKHGNKDLIESYIWNATGWQMYVKYIREFNDNNLLTYAEKKFYNPDTGTWDGCYDWFETGQLIPNTKSIIEYDDKNRDIHEVAYTAYTLENGYEVGSENFTVYTELEDGGLQSEFTSYLIYGPEMKTVPLS